jgi:DNA-binding response OmpR family regulator
MDGMSEDGLRPGRERVLVVEDDRETRELVRDALAAAGYEIEAVGLASEADAAARAGTADAVVLDVWLPDGDGTEICRAWRRSGLGLPVLMLTARSDVASRVSGLDAGADDYMGKPFAMAELRARIAALLRRGRRTVRRVPYRRGPLLIDFARRQAWSHGREIPITRRELAILERLAHEPGQAVTREVLLEAVWGEATPEAAASLEVLVGRIRAKLDVDGQGLIRTLRGVGYALAATDLEGA